MHLENALVLCKKYILFLQSDQLPIHEIEAFLRSSFGLKSLFFMFSERNFSTLKLLNHCNQIACIDLKEIFD